MTFPVAAPVLKHRSLVFAIVSSALLMSSIDQTIVATALTTIQHDLGGRITWLGWVMTIYSLAQIITMPIAGRFSDIYGRKKVFLAGAILFTLGSLTCMLATSVPMLVVCRAVQAVGGGAFMPCATGIVADSFGLGRDRALGLLTSVFPIGALVGPILGGVIVTYWSWQGIFLVNVPIGILLVVLGAKFVPDSSKAAVERTDLPGAFLLAATLLLAMWALALVGSDPIDPRFVGSTFAGSLLVGWLFIRRSKTAEAPFVPMDLLRGRSFGIMNLVNFVYGGAVNGFSVLIPLYAATRYGIRPLEAGTLLTVRAIGIIATVGVTLWIMRRTGYRVLMAGGYLLLALATALTAIPPIGMGPHLWLMIGAGLTGVAMGLATPTSNNATLYLASGRVAAVAGLRGMFRQSGGITAIAVTTAVIASSSNSGHAQGVVFMVFAVLIVAMTPLVYLVPEKRGAW
jgi:MFS family permease